MSCIQQFSDVTKNYLCRFYKILDEMIEGMTNAELTSSLSHNFIVQMIPHHRAAIEMSENLLQFTTFVPLQHIAQNIINDKPKVLKTCKKSCLIVHGFQTRNRDLCLYDRRFRQITQTMFSQMCNACSDNNINADFMREMIPHHQGAIKMSKNVLQYPICPELDSILQAYYFAGKRGAGDAAFASMPQKSINCLISSLVYTSRLSATANFFACYLGFKSLR